MSRAASTSGCPPPTRRRSFPRSRGRAALLTPCRWCGGSCCSGGGSKPSRNPDRCSVAVQTEGEAAPAPPPSRCHFTETTACPLAPHLRCRTRGLRSSTLAAGFCPNFSKGRGDVMAVAQRPPGYSRSDAAVGRGPLLLTITCPVCPCRCRADRVRAMAAPAMQHSQQASRV